MNMPTIRARAKFERVIYGKETPKYRLCQYAGSSEYWEVLKESLASRDGNIYVYLNGELASVSQKQESAEAYLQVVRNSLRLTGLYQYYVEGKASGYASGNPLRDDTFSAKKKPNPLVKYREDCYLFKFEPNKKDPCDVFPIGFEWIVLQGPGVYKLKETYLSVLRIGGFAEALEELPLQSIDTL